MTAPKTSPNILPKIAPRFVPKIALRNVTLGYDRHPAVHHLDGEIAPGALLAVCGPNGAGKSTLFKALTGVLAPMGGTIDLGGARTRDIGYLPQAARDDLSFPIDVFDMAAMGLWRRIGLFGGLSRTDEGQGPTRRWKRWVWRASSAARSARRPAARPSGCCLRASCCRTLR